MIEETPSRDASGDVSLRRFCACLKDLMGVYRMFRMLDRIRHRRYEICADVNTDGIVGIVRCRSSCRRVYSCRLGADGLYGCCTQKLRRCSELNEGMCKHLHMLLFYVVRARQIDFATAIAWIEASRKKRPSLDLEVMYDTFLRYLGASADEADWRPTETLPEDYYYSGK
jgi:hypothetical protein